jgi:hypothetical protein
MEVSPKASSDTLSTISESIKAIRDSVHDFFPSPYDWNFPREGKQAIYTFRNPIDAIKIHI